MSMIRILYCAVILVAMFATPSMAEAPHAMSDEESATFISTIEKKADVDAMHAEVMAEDRFPSATVCAQCHEKQYREWSVSQHAYAQLSPFNATMSNAMIALTNGTIGDFCTRCHTPIGMALDEPLEMSNLDRAQVAVEGVTCIACHRVNKNWGKVNARQHIEEGDIYSTIYGPLGGERLEKVLKDPKYKVSTSPDKLGRGIHAKVEPFFSMVDPAFCGTCHEAILPNQVRGQQALSEYKGSPAADNMVTCNDCHMGREPGVDAGYEFGPAAIVGGVPTPERKLSNHYFAGPDNSIVHPGLFPYHPEAGEMATRQEWLQFDYKAGWGTDAFEDNVTDDMEFPERWETADDRYDGREIINKNLELLEWAKEQRTKILKAGYKLDEFELQNASLDDGLAFKVKVRNGTDGHNAPTGFAMEREVFLQVTVRDANGKIVFQSGDRDPNGDLRTLHSRYVNAGELPLDTQLFSLNSDFVIKHRRGAEAADPLTVPHSLGSLPFLRPPGVPTHVTGGPLGLRIHKKSIEPNGHRWAEYTVDNDLLSGPGEYTVDIKLVSQMLAVSFIDSISFVGFDYGMSPRDVADAVVDDSQVLWEKHLKVEVR